MSNFPYRQVHLDFHTSEKIEGIGSRFSVENFENALKIGHVNSITLFAKCHHGWMYYPSKVGKIHPHLSFDLLSAQLDVCERLGVRTEIYLSAGLDEKYIINHSECLRADKNGPKPLWEEGFHRICFNNKRYLSQLTKEVDEVMRLFGKRTSGIFLDIVGIGECYCQECVKGMLKQGLDVNNPENARTYAKKVYFKYIDAIRKTVDKYDKNMPIIHNDGGAIFQGRDIAFCNRGHFEIESLPTGGWGYDHFPKAAAYARTLGRNFLGMTGKFHRSWGEFGGYKHPNALRYETALSVACGARCSIGDQLHPDGEFDEATYRLIGSAYKEIEEKEEWLGGEYVPDIALFSTEELKVAPKNNAYDVGANRVMLEGHYLYNIVDENEDLDKYKLVILPDSIPLVGKLKTKITNFVKNGGKVLLSGSSGLDENGKFALDFGVTHVGKSDYAPSYMRPSFDLAPNGITDYVTYCNAYKITLNSDFEGEVVAKRVDPYFNRSVEHFCSHCHTPYDREKTSDAVVITKNVAYIGYDIFAEYAQHGSAHVRSLITSVIDKMLDKTLECNLPSCGVTSLFSQADKNRIVHHLVYGIGKVRGNGVEIIEDLPYTGDVECSVKTDKNVKRVYLAPSGKPLEFSKENGVVKYVVPSFSCSELVVIDFE